MSKRTQSNLTTPQQVGKFLLNADFFNSIPTEGETQYDDFFSFMTEFIPLISHEVTEMCGGVTFVPYLDTKEWLSQDLAESSFFIPIWKGVRLYLQDYLLAVEEITWLEEALDAYDFDAQTGSYILMPRRDYPYAQIDFLRHSYPFAFTGFPQRLTVEGFWGYHTDASQLYVATADISITIADATTATITVANIDAYEDQQYIRMEDEIMLIVLRATTKLTVERGANGTTGAVHAAKPITIIKPMRDVQSLATYIAAYSYQNRNTIADSIQVGDIGIIIPKFPQRYQAIINRYQMMAELQLAGML